MRLRDGLPDVVDEEAVAPAADVALDLIGRRDHRARQPEHEVGHRVAGDVAGEVEAPARIVGRPPAGRQAPQVEAGAHVVRAAVVRRARSTSGTSCRTGTSSCRRRRGR